MTKIFIVIFIVSKSALFQWFLSIWSISGLKHEATLIQDVRNANGTALRNTVVYARHNCDDLPDLDVRWQ